MDDPKNIFKTGTLYVVATPIGNMEDITLRALNVLGRVELVAAEDTRHTGKLLAHHKIKRPLIAYHEHNETERTPELVHRLKAGSTVALVSNAGTPSVSDPGYRLVNAAIASGITVVPIPGAAAVVSALSVAGLPTDSFVFIGFAAKKRAKRLKQLAELAHEPRTIIFYESPRRITAFLQEIISTMGDRCGVLCREMTKLHEEFIRGNMSEIHGRLKERATVKGECTLIVKGRQETPDVSFETIQSEIIKTLETTESSLSDLAKTIAKKYGVSKNKIYQEALKIKHEMQNTTQNSKKSKP
jgi:16S rRNA (cytidine1402-2'-O)-methyltransferase